MGRVDERVEVELGRDCLADIFGPAHVVSLSVADLPFIS